MAACKFRVSHISSEPNLRGQPMRRVKLVAVASEPFQADEAPPEGVSPAPPNGEISLLVSPSYAKRFALEDEFDVIFRERE